jgi:hypothetical protein
MKDEPFFADNFFDLLPGEIKRVELKSSAEIPGIDKKLKVLSLADTY